MLTWRTARTFADIGELTARWLEGRIRHYPGYPGGPPDPETTELVPVLARTNRAGYVTKDSQPGVDRPDLADPCVWVQQRAAVFGFVADPRVQQRLVTAAGAAGLIVIVNEAPRWRWRQHGEAMPATRARENGQWQTYTDFGGAASRGDVGLMYEDCTRQVVAMMRSAAQVTLIDPEWGGQERLSEALDRFAS